MYDYDLGSAELIFLTECILSSTGSADDVVNHLRIEARHAGLTFEDYVSAETAKNFLLDKR